MGGEVKQLGKPGIAIYEAAMEVLGLEPEQLVAVGDSLQHDIAGALLGAGVSRSLPSCQPSLFILTVHGSAPSAVVCMTLPLV